MNKLPEGEEMYEAGPSIKEIASGGDVELEDSDAAGAEDEAEQSGTDVASDQESNRKEAG